MTISVTGVALSLASSSLYGAGVSPDSTGYLSAARSLLAGHGYVCYDGTLYTGWPPLFPTLLAAIGLTGIDPTVGARFLNAFAFGGIILASGLFFARCLKSKVLSVVATVSVLLSYPLLDISVMALTEAVFVLLIALFVLQISAFLRDGRTVQLVAAATLAALCLLQRYTGVALVFAGAVLIMLSDHHTRLPGRLKHLGCFLVISCTPMTVWVIRNLLLTRLLSGHPRLHSIFSLRDNVVYAIDTATKWLVPESVSLSVRAAIVAGLLLLAVAMLLLAWRAHRHADSCHPYVWSAAVVMLVYIPLLLYTHQVGVLDEPLNDRYLSPLAVLLLWLMFAGIDKLQVRLSARLGTSLPIVAGLCVLWLIYPLGRVRDAVSVYRTHGAGGYSWKGWQTSPLVQWLRNHPLQGQVRCNAPDALYALIGRSALVSPHRGWDMHRFAEMISAGSGESLVWFSGLPRTYLYDLDELVPMLNVEERMTFLDGGIYRLQPVSNSVFPSSRIFTTCMTDGLWNRSFTTDQLDLRGEVTSWVLRPDGTMDSTWRLSTPEGTPISWRGCGSYTRSHSSFEFRDPNLEVEGTVDGDVATGTYRLAARNPQWPAVISGSWRVDLARRVYRLYSPRRGKHLYTMSKEEVIRLTNDLLDRWACEGVAFHVYAEGQHPPEARPVYALRSDTLGSRFLTMDQAERDRLTGEYGHVWTGAGVAFYAFSQDSRPCAARPVYRFWSGTLSDHFYTASDAERDKLIRDFPHVWTYEGIGWYAIVGSSPSL